MTARSAPPQEIPLAQACHRLHESYSRVYRRVLAGELSGRFFAGRWLVAVHDVERLARELERTERTEGAA